MLLFFLLFALWFFIELGREATAGLIHHQEMMRCPKLFFSCTSPLTVDSKTTNRSIFNSRYKGLLFSTASGKEETEQFILNSFKAGD